MAFDFGLTWEVRGATGSDSNGGAFLPGATGTDYSQQDAAQYALTGLTTAAANAIILTASAAADMVGNVIQITSGTNFTVGFYQIKSVSVGVSITVDRNCTTAAGASGVGNIGGALLTVQKATAALNNELQTIFMKAGADYTFTSRMDIPTGAGSNLSYIGYTTTRTDEGKVNWKCSTNSVSIVSNNAGAFTNLVFKNIAWSNSAGTPLYGFVTVAQSVGCVRFDNCTFDGFNQAIRGDNNSAWQINQLMLTRCEIKNSVSDGIFNTNGTTDIVDCYIHSNGGAGFHCGNVAGYGGKLTIVRSTFKSNTLAGVLNSNGSGTEGSNDSFIWISADQSNFLDNGRSGIEMLNTTSAGVRAHNCIFDGNTRYGLEAPTATGVGTLYSEFQDIRNCAFRSNTLGKYNTASFAPTSGDITLTGDPFTNRGADDFSLNNTAGAGADCRAAGYPGVLNVGGTGYPDIGMLQHQDSGGGGTTTYVIAPNIVRQYVEQET